ncbi:4555_t:CDS:2 [Acaulospora morrowiae]|uniref:4555_t:CDS:1 n=1 Tax=Acaulospora morrowiae TaxID=94023 RepID=A0A9N9F7T7_9GLOM|nr:4555_t:CDS:2 [Acaulospora morrowiae]
MGTSISTLHKNNNKIPLTETDDTCHLETSKEDENSASRSDVREYVGTRKLDKKVKCTLSLDNDEADRQTMQHFIYRHLWEGNFSAPVNEILTDGARILDVGCGSGTFLLDMATEFPNSHFIGIDVSSNFPKEIKPANLDFFQSDILEGLPFRDGLFDFVYIRFMEFDIKKDDWPKIFLEVARVLKPGGYIEIMEKNYTLINEPPSSTIIRERFYKFMKEKYRVEHDLGNTIDQMKKSLNFTDIQHEARELPVGSWGGNLGKGVETTYHWHIMSLRKLLFSQDISDEEFKKEVDNCMADLDKYKPREISYRYWAKKVQNN